MMTYMTRDENAIDESAFAHFFIGEIHYVACFDICVLDGVQRIPWELFQSKMKHNKAIWVTPESATKARAVFDANRDEFLRYISYFDPDGQDRQEFIPQSEKPRDRSLIDVESERTFKKQRMRSWR